jgi:hypothetical protein
MRGRKLTLGSSSEIAPVRRAAKAAANAVGAAADVTEDVADAVDGRVNNNRFGYRDPNPDPNVAWFYDYYTYTPTYYYAEGNADRYYGAIRYFDQNNDGIYDYHSYYRDSDDDGYYDEYNRFDFAAEVRSERVEKPATEVRTETNVEEIYSGPLDARRHVVEGKIELTKAAKVNGDENLIVKVVQQNDETIAVDVGPVQAMKGRNVEVGQAIRAIGPLQTIGDKTVLIADEVTIAGETMTIDRFGGTTLTGTVVDITETRLATGTHYLAVVEVDGKRHLVDLGAITLYEQPVQAKVSLTVHGVPIETHGHQVFIANRVKVGDKVITIQERDAFNF